MDHSGFTGPAMLLVLQLLWPADATFADSTHHGISQFTSNGFNQL